MQTPQRPRDLPACLSRGGLRWAQARLRALARSLPILPAIYQRGNKKAHEIAADLCVNVADWATVTPPPPPFLHTHTRPPGPTPPCLMGICRSERVCRPAAPHLLCAVLPAPSSASLQRRALSVMDGIPCLTPHPKSRLQWQQPDVIRTQTQVVRGDSVRV